MNKYLIFLPLLAFSSSACASNGLPYDEFVEAFECGGEIHFGADGKVEVVKTGPSITWTQKTIIDGQVVSYKEGTITDLQSKKANNKEPGSANKK